MNVSSKVNLYDTLAMVIPGFLLLMLLQLFICRNCLPDIPCIDNDFVTVTLIFIASYVAGLIYHKVVEWIFEILDFRNNSDRIKKNADKFFEEYDKDRDYTETKDHSQYNRYEYYKAYYRLMKINMLGNIPTLETQVAFVRNMAVMAFLYSIGIFHVFNIFTFISYYHHIVHALFQNQPVIQWCVAAIITMKTMVAISILLWGISAALFWVMVKIQDKIYFLVWEGNEYLKEIQTNHHE